MLVLITESLVAVDAVVVAFGAVSIGVGVCSAVAVVATTRTELATAETLVSLAEVSTLLVASYAGVVASPTFSTTPVESGADDEVRSLTFDISMSVMNSSVFAVG